MARCPRSSRWRGQRSRSSACAPRISPRSHMVLRPAGGAAWLLQYSTPRRAGREPFSRESDKIHGRRAGDRQRARFVRRRTGKHARGGNARRCRGATTRIGDVCMLEWLRTPAAIVFVFGVVIFVHELGHFIAAKLMGVYAPRFSIGFGPALLSHKWGETEYILAALPLGGYVRMASREDESMAFLEGGSETPTPGAEVGGNGAPAIVPEGKPRYYDPNGMAPFGPCLLYTSP